MNFSDHQKRIWESMIRLTDDYLNNKIEFGYLVSSLEGVLDAAEIKEEKLIKNWYKHWTPLEIINAETEQSISEQEKKSAVQEMKKYLETVKE